MSPKPNPPQGVKPGDEVREPWNLTEAQRRQFREAHAEAKRKQMVDDFAKDIAAKARWAIVHNDGQPKPAWSTGERLAVALVVGYPDLLEAEGAARSEALSRLAGDIMGGPADAEAWIKEVRAAL